MHLKSLVGSWLLCTALIGLSVLLFGAAPSGISYVGGGADPELFIWFLNWFPFALRHHLDLFWTHFVAAPTGMSLAWHTAIPALGLVATPFTLKYGALATYNGLMRIAPGLAGVGAFWAARELTGRTWPAFVAGLVFGFSPYEMGQSGGHLNLSFTIAVPLLVWTVLRAIRCEWPPALLALATGVLFAFQFGVSQEIAANLFMLTGLAACWIWVRAPDFRPLLQRLTPGIVGGLSVAFVLTSPLLFVMVFDGGRSGTSIAPPADFSTDLLNFVAPTPVTLPLSHAACPLSLRFKGNFSEEAGYLGIPLLVLLIWIASRTREQTIRLPLELTALAAILSLGPFLHVAGHEILPAPWLVLSWLPVLDDMLPARFMLYAWLALALGLAAWLAQPHLPKIVAGRFAIAVVVCAFCVPNTAQVGQWTRLQIPSIFTAHGANAIPAGASVFILPFTGDHIGEQYVSELNFRLVAQGYLGGGIAQPFSQWPLIAPLFNNDFDAVDRREFATFLASYGVQEVLVERDSLSDPTGAAALVSGAGWKLTFRHGSVNVYLPAVQPPSPAALAQEQEGFFEEKQLNTLERRERMNVCAIRRTEAEIGVHLTLIWSIYQKYSELPSPIGTVTCNTSPRKD
ncbi:MAG TPA: hypothetical protein VL356_12310 [Acidocella sp.]|nr:hypothetical protein [Acidocella sp.]